MENTLQFEEWRPVVGYEGLYEVSSFGQVRSVDRVVYQNNHPQRRKSIIKKQTPHKDGHLMVMLSKEGHNKNCQVHRLVAQAFIPNPDNLPVINHKDEKPNNNCVDNLEWCTIKYNNNYGTVKERISKHNINHPSLSEKIYQYTLDGEFVKEWPSIAEAVRVLGYKGKPKRDKGTQYGFMWKSEYCGEKTEPYKRPTPSYAKRIFRYDLDMNFIDEWPSAAECQRQTGINRLNINQCCRGVQHKTNGFIFRYADNNELIA